MPSFLETLKYGYIKYIQPKRARIIHILSRIVICLVLAALLEVVLFNFRSITTLFNKPIDLAEKINLQQTDDERFVITSNQNTIELKNLNIPINSLNIQMNNGQDAQVCKLKINFTDSGHSTYFDTTEYTVGVPDVTVSTVSDRSQYFVLHATGQVKDLKILVHGEDIGYPLYFDTIIANPQFPFTFVVWRFLVAFVILYLLYIFRPKSSVYKIKLLERPAYTKIAISATVFIEAILLSAYVLLGSNLVGVATPYYNFGDWDGVSPINTFEVAGDNAQQYAEIAKSFTKGKLYLEEDPPEYLKTMDDPYDKGSRDEMQKKTGEEYLFDVGYYDGHYYVYFGVVPVLLFYLPFYLIAGSNFPTAIGVLIMCILFIVGISILLDRFARYHFERVSLGLYLLLQIPLVACSSILYLCKFPTFYSLPIACAIAFAVWGLYFWMKGRESQNPCGWYFAGSFCMALIAGCRPQIMLICLVAIPLFWRKFITNAKTEGLLCKKGIYRFLCLALPFIIVGAGIMWYNYARFGSVTNFGANYNLTMNDMTQRGMQLSRVLPAFFAYFLQAPNTTGVFPFINPVLFETTYYGQTIKEVTFGGVLATMPILWVLFLSPIILSIRRRARKTNTIMGVVIVLIVSAVLIPILDAQVAGILQRYYADFSFMLLIAAILLIFIVNEKVTFWNRKQKNILKGVLLVAVGFSVVFNLLICFVIESGWYGDVYDWAYIDTIKQVLFWT